MITVPTISHRNEFIKRYENSMRVRSRRQFGQQLIILCSARQCKGEFRLRMAQSGILKEKGLETTNPMLDFHESKLALMLIHRIYVARFYLLHGHNSKFLSPLRNAELLKSYHVKTFIQWRLRYITLRKVLL